MTQTNSKGIRSLYHYEIKEETMPLQYETITIILLYIDIIIINSSSV